MRAPATLIIARILGPLLLIIGIAIAVRPSTMVGVLEAFAADASTPLIWAVFALTFGLVILAFHWRWRGLVESVITLIACLSVVRGIVLLFMPETAIGLARTLLSAAPYAVLAIGVVSALIGAWLLLESFRNRTML